MKKRIISILAVVIASFIAVFATGCSGCSGCAGDKSLMFNNNFLGGGTSSNAQVGYSEVLNYSVEFKESYSGIQKNLNTNELFDYNFSNGSYKTTFTALPSLPEGISMQFSLGENALVYHLKTEFNIDAWYKVTGEYAEGGEDLNGGKLYHDSIISEVYFLPAGQSFAPIKAITKQTQSTLFLGSKPSVNYQTYEVITEFKANSYTQTTTFEKESKTNTSDYTLKSAIDNTQLLFAIRNINVNLDATFELPTISPAYSSPQTLAVRNQSEETVSTTIDGLGENLQIAVKNLMIYRNGDRNTGCPQYAKIQKTDSTNPQAKSLLVEYVASLMPYDTPFAFMGALVYTLNSVSYN